MKVTITLATLGGALATTTASVTVSPDPCAAVYNSCVQSGITMAGGPNFAYCGAQSEACLSTAMPVTTSMSTATTSYNNCGLVYDSCVASGLSMAGGPNYAYCGAQSEECLKTAMPSTISSAYVVISTSVSSASATTDACYSVYESCVQSGITMLGGPNFAYCGAQSEACLKTAMPSSVASMTAKTTLVAPTTKPKPTGAVYTTKVVTAYTTYCPYPTTISVGPGKTITVTSATTLTITDCPCTVTMPKPMPSASIPMGPGPVSIPSSAVVIPASSTTSAGAVYTGGAQKLELEIVGVAVAGIAAFLI